MALIQRRGSKIWTFQCKVNGTTFTKSTGETDLRKAEDRAAKFAQAAQLRRKQPRDLLTLSKAAVHEVARVEEEISEYQAKRVYFAMKNFIKFAGDLPLDRVDDKLIEDFQRSRLKKAARSTVDKEVCFVLKILRVNGFHLQRPTPKRGKVTEQREFSAAELNAFFSVCSDRLRLVYALLLVTGARVAEIVPSVRSVHVPLLKKEVDLDRRMIALRSAKVRQGKRGKVRRLPIPESLVEPLRLQMEAIKGPHVFEPLHNGPRDFDSVLKAAGIPKFDELKRKVTAHSFRHTYATIMAEAVGHNPFTLKELLGHQQLSMTERYCHAKAPCIPPDFQAVTDLGFSG